MVQNQDARERVEELRQTLSEDLKQLDQKVRHELDWKARLRRLAPKIAVGTVPAVAASALGLARRRRRKSAAKLVVKSKQVWRQTGEKAVFGLTVVAGAAGGTYLTRKFISRKHDRNDIDNGEENV